MFKTLIALSVFVTAMLVQSCTPSKKAIYFNNITDTSYTSVNMQVDPVIQKNDLLNISVSSANPEATFVFNTPNLPSINSAVAVGSAPTYTGYLVNADGNIKFPVLGNIKAAGLSKIQLTENITNLLVDRKQLIDPVVSVRLLNFKVTILGDVSNPMVINVPNEKISIMEAIGMAGDLTMYARRDKIMLIREENGQKVVHRVNLNAASALSSPYYYLQSNDVVYAEPDNLKINRYSNFRQLLPTIISAASLVAVLATRIF